MRNAALVTFVGVNHQSFTFCYLFFFQSADLEFCSAEAIWYFFLPPVLHPLVPFYRPRGTDIVEPVVASRMDANGQLYVQRVLDKKGLPIGQEYDRSMPLNSVQIDVPPEDRVTWFTTENVNSGYCEFIPDDGILKVCRVHGSKFEACTLMEVNNNTDGDTEVGHKNDFPPILCKMLKSKTDWGRELSIRGLAEFRPGILEWTEAILRDFKEELFRVEIYGAVAVSRYPYMYSLSVWKAFLELWGPLTNTLHQGNGEMGISLYDLKIIGGLPILGVPYEEFIPPNRDLHCEAMFPPTIRELLLIYSQLCSLYDQKCVFWDQWVAHFFRGKIIYGTFGEGNILKPRENLMARKLNLEISTEGRLTAFLAFFLSRFALPSRGSRIRPETFYMASLMARGIKVSIAPTVLGYIYHGLGETVTCPRGPGTSLACFPVHYVIGWMGEYFPCLYRCHNDIEFPASYPHLTRYAGIAANDMDISKARVIFRSDISMRYRPSAFDEHDGLTFMDDEKLSDDRFEILVCTRSSKLPIRVDNKLWLEPYHPNRFARQFGFDQGVPSDKLGFGISKRSHCNVEDLFRAQTSLLRRNTSALFFIPRSTRMGQCTYWYCRWWMGYTASYLGLSVSTVYVNLSKRPLKEKPIYVISNLKEVSTGLQKEVLISEVEARNSSINVKRQKETSRPGKRQKERACRKNEDTFSSSGSSQDVNFKRIRYPKSDGSLGTGPERAKVTKDVVLDNSNFEANSGLLNPLTDNSVAQELAKSSPCGANIIFPLANGMSSLEGCKKSIFDIFGSEAKNFRHVYIIGEVQGIFDKLHSSKSSDEILAHHEGIKSVFNVLRSMLDILDFGKTELEWFVNTIDQIFCRALQISENARIVEQGTRVRDLIHRHDDCLNSKKVVDSDLSNFTRELEDLDAQEFVVKEAEERARILREQHDSRKLSLNCQIKDAKSSLEKLNKLDEELRQSRSGEKELLEIEHIEASCKSQEVEIQKLIASLVPFCNKS
ncbi:hypothetical protein L3X38_043782 [Prunus dulcis]|uniref:Aminotransferase-like plant mobile domain-containing protein n=1 Tax=Prunus dulcis TaxID=3755 RepID=A0AAD4UYW0_PRUDU|nr:hypothetical protein L3X38_043782 [Prunus dulcis]